MPTALFLSPHLDDVVFSCGGLAASLVDAGWITVLATAFTRSVVPATGFALACQLDKGLSADVDYMALRRAEDRDAADLLAITHLRWLDLLEAPHRGYDAAPALFGTIHPADPVAEPLAAAFASLAAKWAPDLVLAPQGLGNHVDHQQVIHAALNCFPPDRLAFYRDTPYVIRQPAAQPLALVPPGPSIAWPIGRALPRKIAAAQAYTSQIGFQFGGREPLAAALTDFAQAEGHGEPSERLTGAGLTYIQLSRVHR